MPDIEMKESYNYDKFEKFEPENLACKCLVHFRPSSGWKGEGYGFDWMRLQDYMPNIFHSPWDPNNYGDTPYKAIINRHYVEGTNMPQMDPNNIQGSYIPDPIMFNRLKNTYGYHNILWKVVGQTEGGRPITDEYYCSWLSLSPEKSALLSLIVDVDEIPDKIEIKYDENIFDVSPKIVDGGSLKIGENVLKDFLTVTCKTEFRGKDREEEIINAFVYKGEKEYLAGQLFVWENLISKHKNIKVLLVEVQVDEPENKRDKDVLPTPGQASIGLQTPYNEVLGQAYLRLEEPLQIVGLSVWDDPNFRRFYMTDHNTIIAYYYNSPAPAGYTGILSYLQEKSKKEIKDFSKYDEYIKIFVFEEFGGRIKEGSYKDIGGFSNHETKDIIVFRGKAPETIVHEVLHSLGLPHSFTDKSANADALFTYKHNKTNNIMDYTSSYARKFSMWLWQWRIANQNVDKSGYIKK